MDMHHNTAEPLVDALYTRFMEGTASQGELEEYTSSPDVRNRELAVACSHDRKETTNELELKVSQLQEQHNSREKYNTTNALVDALFTHYTEGTASQGELEEYTSSPDVRNREPAVACSHDRKETTNELELKVSRREEQHNSREKLMDQHWLQVFPSRPEGMASQQEVEVDAPLPNIRNMEWTGALLHARKEAYINELELKVSKLEEENSIIEEAKTYINELELKVSKLEEENSKLKEAKRSSAMFLSNQHDSVAIVTPANQFTAACSSSEKECNKPQRKLGLGLNLEDLKPHFGKRLHDVAEELGVGRSTIKRACREYGIHRWPGNMKIRNPTNGISCRDYQQNTPPSAASSKNVTMKVRFEDDTIKFDFCLSSGMEKLLSEVGRRLNLNVGDFKLKYLDEDGDDILLACDDDLQFYLKSLANVVENTCIKLFVHL